MHQLGADHAIYVTHDQVEAMTLGDRIAVHVRRRACSSSGRPQERLRPPGQPVRGRLHRQPADEPDAPAVGARACSRPARSRCRCPGAADGDVVLGVRPERLAPAADATPPALEMAVEVVEPLGSEVIVHGSVARRAAPPRRSCHGPADRRRAGAAAPPPVGEDAAVGVRPRQRPHVRRRRPARPITTGVITARCGQPLGVGSRRSRPLRAPRRWPPPRPGRGPARRASPAPPSRASTSPARNESPLPTG